MELGSTPWPRRVGASTRDTSSAAQAQLDSFIEKWKSEHVNAIFMAGLDVSAKQFVEKIKAALPNALLLADADSTAEPAQDEVKAGKTPIRTKASSATGRSAAGAAGDKRAHCCSNASTSTRRPPETEKPGRHRRKVVKKERSSLNRQLRDAERTGQGDGRCSAPTIATKAGKKPRITRTWVKAVD